MLKKIREKILKGKRLTRSDALKLFETDDIFALGELASYVAKNKNGNKAYFVRNLHVNPTNICVNRCGFCAFSRSKGENGAFELTIKDILRRIRKAQPISEVHIVGGLHPEWQFEYYLEMLSSIKKSFPELHIKAFTATEVDYMHRISGLSLKDVLKALKSQGLDSMPGGGAEIFHSSVRNRLCPEKLSGERWLEVMEAAHSVGIKTNATMLYGHIENYEHRVDHLMRLRELQDRTGGFQAFIPLSYHPKNTEIGGRNSSGIDDLKTIAVSRLVLDNFPHIKAYWVMLGEKVSQLALLFGADDLDGTVIDEKITYSAGGKRTGITENELVHLIKKAGKKPVERDSFYRSIRRCKTA
jgi:aminodeoxyfutalosine synthase